MKNLKKIMMGLIVLAMGFISFSFADEDCEQYKASYESAYRQWSACTLNNSQNEINSDLGIQNPSSSMMDDGAAPTDCESLHNLYTGYLAKYNECIKSAGSGGIASCNAGSVPDCDADKIYNSGTGCACCINGVVQNSTVTPGAKDCVQNYYGTMGLDINTECLKNGQCHMNVYRTLGIRKSDDDPEVQTFVQDIILGATEFFGTVITVVLMISGLFYIISAMNGKTELSGRAKKAMIGSIVGLLFVTLSYSIIRLIQFLATGGS